MSHVGWAFLARDPEVSRLRSLVEYLRAVEDDEHEGGEFVFGLDTRTPQETFDLLAQWPGSKVIPIEWTDDFSAARNQVISQVESPWTISLDPDEMPSHAMLWEIHEIVRRKNKDVAFLMWFRNFYGATNLRLPPFESDWHLRMWRTGVGEFYRPVHELVAINGKPEHQTRGSTAVKIPDSRYIIHAKPPSTLIADTTLYVEMEQRTK